MEEEIYDQFSYTVAYLIDGRVELRDITEVIEVKEGSPFATNENMEELLKDIEGRCVEERGCDPYELDLQYIYRGCKRMVHIEGQKPQLLMQT